MDDDFDYLYSVIGNSLKIDNDHLYVYKNFYEKDYDDVYTYLMALWQTEEIHRDSSSLIHDVYTYNDVRSIKTTDSMRDMTKKERDDETLLRSDIDLLKDKGITIFDLEMTADGNNVYYSISDKISMFFKRRFYPKDITKYSTFIYTYGECLSNSQNLNLQLTVCFVIFLKYDDLKPHYIRFSEIQIFNDVDTDVDLDFCLRKDRVDGVDIVKVWKEMKKE